MSTANPLGKSYEPEAFEEQRYLFWEKNHCFDAVDESVPGQKAFCMVIPPPNVTGVLHMGHALTDTIQDILIRWRRMSGDNTLWVPGTDHAGIATQAQVEKQIAKEGKGPSGRPLSRHDLGRAKFLERTWKWKEDHKGIIRGQTKRMGCSLDWKRERFTMDEGLSKAVREVFVRLFEEGLIYRADRIVNWDVKAQTVLSDLEVIPTERKGSLWHIRYDIVEKDGSAVKNPDGSNASIVIATTRPETLLGDSALAVHPEDDRFTHFHGKFAKLPLMGRLIPVITDAYVDREFGSGGLKVTPAHDFNDYELGMRHKLPMVSVMGKDGRITAEGGKYSGLKFAEARTQVLEDLQTEGFLVKTEDHTLKIGLSQRTDTVAEPMVSKQWWVKIEPLAKPAIEAVKDGRITFTPENWSKTYFEWMNNIRDWCISRQLWWGHQIPAWYCSQCEDLTVARETPAVCSKCKADASHLKQDEDVLDTWFSSALWPFSTLGWPEETAALKTFYPTAILETGFDIIFFWVARMIMMGMHFMGDVPFRKVYLHAMVRDEKGEKMSKSKGNVIDPLELISQHGADPLRFTLAAMAGQGRDIKLNTDRVEGYRGFCNKIWNATKFLHLQLDQAAANGQPITEPREGAKAWLKKMRPELLPANAWILSRLQKAIAKVEHGFEKFELNESAQALYEFAWHELCDWYIEFAKLPLRETGAARDQTVITLHYVLEELFTLMHPVMPFVTEELWQSLPWIKEHNLPNRESQGIPAVKTLMFKAFPKPDEKFNHPEAERTIEATQAVANAIRNFRGENGISPKTEFMVDMMPGSAAAAAFLQIIEPELKSLVKIKGLRHLSKDARAKDTREQITKIVLSQPPVELLIDLDGLVDQAQEAARVEKEISKLKSDLDFITAKLSKPSFVEKAPAELVAKERERGTELAEKIKELTKTLARFKK